MRILCLNAKTVERVAIGQENVPTRQSEQLAYCVEKTLMTLFHAQRRFALSVIRLVTLPLIVLKRISLNAIVAVLMGIKRFDASKFGEEELNILKLN